MNTSDNIALIIQWIVPIQMFISQFLYNNANSTLSYYLFPKKEEQTQYEHELDRLQINRLLKWLQLFFEQYPPSDSDSKIEDDNIKNLKHQYIKELYQIYKTIQSDYNQYEQWKSFNNGLWFLRNYRMKSTNDLAKKIISDVTLFNEGLNLFSKM